jgi:hypothetical protein
MAECETYASDRRRCEIARLADEARRALDQAWKKTDALLDQLRNAEQECLLKKALGTCPTERERNGGG